MSIKKALTLSALIPVALAVSLPASAMGPGGQAGQRPAFSELDADADGQLTLEELTAHREARFTEADTDGDGSLSRAELISAALDRVEARIDAQMARFDDNEDGVLSANEMDDMRPRGPGPEQAFARMDADGDGMVSEAEFDAMAQIVQQRRGGGHGGERGHGHGGGWGHHGGAEPGHGHRWWGTGEEG